MVRTRTYEIRTHYKSGWRKVDEIEAQNPIQALREFASGRQSIVRARPRGKAGGYDWVATVEMRSGGLRNFYAVQKPPS